MTKFETETCSRCHGTGKHSFCERFRDICFKCHGDKVVLTARGAAAKAFFERSCTIPANELAIGDRVKTHSITMGGAGFTYIGTVSEIERRTLQRVVTRTLQDNGNLTLSHTDTFNGEFVSGGSEGNYTLKPGEELNLGTTTSDYVETTVTITHDKYGAHKCVGYSEYRIYRADDAERLAKALEYQATLTKTGKPRKTFKKLTLSNSSTTSLDGNS
jgi:hypothetical protein